MKRRFLLGIGGLVVIPLAATGAFFLIAHDRLLPTAPKVVIDVGVRQREYLLHVPRDLPRDRPAPLLFVFHGGNGEAQGTLRLTRFNEIADREGFLVVYPQGVGRSWNDGRVTQVSQAHREHVDDLAFFDTVLAKVSREHRIDSRQVFATGISNGGIFSHYLAANRAEKLAAIAPVVGGIAEPFDQKFLPAAPVSVLIVQGTADPLVPYVGGKIAFRDGQDRGSVIGTEQAARLWIEANGCLDEPVTENLPDHDPHDECRITAKKWSGGRGGSVVWLYRIEGGGHAWPGGIQYAPKAFIGRVTRDLHSQAIWDFFKKHPQGESERPSTTKGPP